MKKAMAFVMALVMSMLCASVMAEDVEKQVYTSPAKSYTITVPGDWLCVDKTNIDAYIEAYEKGEMTFSGTNAMTLESLKPQIISADCAVLINPYANNVVIVKEAIGLTLTNDTFVSMMIPLLKQQLTSQMLAIEFTAEGERLTLGDKEFVLLAAEYSLNGITASVDMLFYLDGSALYTLNLTTTPLFGQDVVNAFYADVQEACATFQVLE